MFKVRPFWKIMLSRKYPVCGYFPSVLTAWEKGGSVVLKLINHMKLAFASHSDIFTVSQELLM